MRGWVLSGWMGGSQCRKEVGNGIFEGEEERRDVRRGKRGAGASLEI